MVVKTKITNPVILNEDNAFIKRQLSVDLNDNIDDDYINTLLYTSTVITENLINKDISYTKNVLSIYDFNNCEIVIDEGNYYSVESVILDTSTLVDPSTYDVINYYNYFKINFNQYLTSDPIKITYYTGYYGKTIPQDLYHAIVLKAADLYDVERNSYNYTGIENNKAWERLCLPYKLIH